MRDELSHHGVRGQKWGKRNGPPYPLNSKGKAKLRKQRMDSYSKSGDSKSGMSAFLTRAENSRTSHITNNKTGNEYWQEDREYAVSNLKGGTQSFSIAVGEVNGIRRKYQDSPDYQNNCVNCATAMINRKKGFLAQAGPNADGVANEAIGFYFDGAKREEPSYDKVEDTILAHGPGSYGVMGTKTKFGIGHETVWEVDSNNNVTIYDAQPIGGKVYKSFKEYKDTLGVEDWAGTSVYDLTNATPNLANQAEDHAFYPGNSANEPGKFSVKWDTAGRNYKGPSAENTSMDWRMEAYGLR